MSFLGQQFSFNNFLGQLLKRGLDDDEFIGAFYLMMQTSTPIRLYIETAASRRRKRFAGASTDHGFGQFP